MTVGTYAKAIVAAAAAGLAAAVTALDDGIITGPEWTVIAVATLTAAGGVWALPNLPGGVRRYGKAIAGGLIAGLGALGTALSAGGVQPADWVTIALAVVGGLGITYAVPNADYSDGLGPAARASH